MRSSGAQGQTIAAVIPLYNGERFIERALLSVTAQTRPPDEILVVDDGSTDAGADRVRALSGSGAIKLIRKTNGGQSSARNLGVARSSASLIAFLDQDDLWYPDHLAALEQSFATHAGPLGWSYTDLDIGDLHGEARVARFHRTRPGSHPKSSLQGCLAFDMFILPSASLIARWAFDRVGGFDERLSGYEDDDLFLRMFQAGVEHVYVDRPLSMWCIHETSATSLPAMSRSRMIFAQKVLGTFGALPTAKGSLATVAIVPRFFRSLLGEYARAVRDGDAARAAQARGDLRQLVLPHGTVRHRTLLRFATALLSIRWLSSLLTRRRAAALPSRGRREAVVWRPGR
jgi:GT2 family glycosyltransferase